LLVFVVVGIVMSAPCGRCGGVVGEGTAGNGDLRPAPVGQQPAQR